MHRLALLLVLAACGPAAVPVGESVRLRVVTFNVQDLFVADRRAERMRAIGRVLGGLKPDLVGLQEAFDADNRKQLVSELERIAGRTYHTQYFRSGVMGSGLLVLSAHPIEQAVFFRYTKNGSSLHVKQGDWFAGKGVGMVRVRVAGGAIDFFNTHAIANYMERPYLEDRKQQMRELADFVAAQAQGPALVVGDLNCSPGSPEYVLGTKGLTDLTGTGQGRIDHILATRDLPATNFQVLSSGTGDDGAPLRLSDHAGYVLDVTLSRP